LLLAQACTVEGELVEASQWAERAISSARADLSIRRQTEALSALLSRWGDTESDILAPIGFTAARTRAAPADDPELLAWRGAANFLIDDLDAAIGDLRLAGTRLHASGNSRAVSQCLCWLAAAEYRHGDWDDAAFHAELAVKLTQDAGRLWELCFGHAFAAAVSTARGDWSTAAAHVESSREAAGTLQARPALTAAALAAARLGLARGQPQEALDALAAVYDAGPAGPVGGRSRAEWRALEIDALTDLGELVRATELVHECMQAARPSDRRSDTVAIARVSGNLAQAKGDVASAEMAFRQAWNAARGLNRPFEIARLELDDGRRLRRSGRRAEAVRSLRSARDRLESLNATPYLELCDKELAACGIGARAEMLPSALGLTRSELAVAGLVAEGKSNREVAAELFLSVKTVEFHLRHVFSKLQIHGRRELAELMQG